MFPKMNYIFLGIIALLSFAAVSEVEQAAVPMNVLWIIAEDMGPELGAYGYAQVETPNIDALARRSMLFENAFTTAPICSTSRSALMTGMYANSMGAHHHRTAPHKKQPLPDGVDVISRWYQQAGFFTANVVDLTGDPNERFYRGTGKKDWNFRHQGKAFQSNKWLDLKGNQPFYAQVNLAEAHRMLSDWSRAHEHIQTPADPKSVVFPPYYPAHSVVGQDWANYLNAIMALDKKIGFILQKLEQDGLAQNTIVFFFSDHGRAMVRGKQWVYDSGLHIPLLIHLPQALKAKGYQAGTASQQLISGIDIPATSLALSGISRPLSMQGRAFLAQLEAPREFVFSARDRADEAVEQIRSVRNKRYRYIRNFLPQLPYSQRNRYKENIYPPYKVMQALFKDGALNEVQAVFWQPTKPAEELYDLINDPYEIRNLAFDPSYQPQLELFRQELARWQVEIADQGREPESEQEVDFWRAQMIDYFEVQKKHLKRHE